MHCRGGTDTDTDPVTITTDPTGPTGPSPDPSRHLCHDVIDGVGRLTPWSAVHITQGCHPWGDRLREEQKTTGGPRTNFSVVGAPRVVGHTKICCQK